jgi:hypothetical protein
MNPFPYGIDCQGAVERKQSAITPNADGAEKKNCDIQDYKNQHCRDPEVRDIEVGVL